MKYWWQVLFCLCLVIKTDFPDSYQEHAANDVVSTVQKPTETNVFHATAV